MTITPEEALEKEEDSPFLRFKLPSGDINKVNVHFPPEFKTASLDRDERFVDINIFYNYVS